MPHYDAIVIGSGQAGNPLSQKLADRGWTVALVEKEHLGGTCVNTGCTPTKTMIASAQVAYYARNADRWGSAPAQVSVDLPKVVARKDRVVGQSRAGLNRKVEERKTLHLYRGHARFIGPHEVRVGEEVLESERIFIDTGTRPDVPHLEGLGGIDFLDNASIMRLTEVPEHLLVLGGGYVGMEFGQMFRRFGSRVTVVQREQQILPHEDADVAEALQQALEGEGIRFLLGATTTRVEKEQGGVALSVVVDGSHGDGARVPPAGRHRTQAEYGRPGIARGRGADRSTGVHPGEQPAGDERAGRLGPGRRQGRPGVHTHLLQRLPDRVCQPD